ncbi:hypothetical protein SCHPADRAFT_904156 [Schizopora paradoxa]|uniref:Uncharacterized protein n=1 Tax=Schizopora paradoxa TaxID=27342 RepID=A0A0H2RNK1_9AGAM|nr:hypothetical protein SCHPADRAFT_904156 [Schizopora paradoxa]
MSDSDSSEWDILQPVNDPRARLLAVERKLSLVAKEIAKTLLQIERTFGAVSRILRYNIIGDIDRDEVVSSWDNISRKYASAVWQLRDLAADGAVTIDDFASHFSSYLLTSQDSISDKRSELGVYLSDLKSRCRSSGKASVQIANVQSMFLAFRDKWSATIERHSNNFMMLMRTIENDFNVLLRSSLSSDQDETGEIATMLNNNSFPGIMASMITLLPLALSKPLYQEMEGSASRIEVEDRTFDGAGGYNLIEGLFNVPRILITDLTAIAESLRLRPDDASFVVDKLRLVLRLYGFLETSLRDCSISLSGTSPASPRRFMGKFFGSWDDLKGNRKSTRDLLEMFQDGHETTSNDQHTGMLRVKLLSLENLKEKAAEKMPIRRGTGDSFFKKRGKMLRLARKWACLEPIVEEF